LTARLLGASYSASQMTYDLRRLRLNGLIRRIEHTHTYVLTLDADVHQAHPPRRTHSTCTSESDGASPCDPLFASSFRILPVKAQLE
jgi:hypothetical protein